MAMLRFLIQSLLLSIVVLMFGCAMFEKVLLVQKSILLFHLILH